MSICDEGTGAGPRAAGKAGLWILLAPEFWDIASGDLPLENILVLCKPLNYSVVWIPAFAGMTGNKRE